MPSISKLHHKCETCGDKDNCDNKRLEACAYIPSIPLLSMGGVVSSGNDVNPFLAPNDCREIVISGEHKVTIDLEAIRREIRNSICPINLQIGV